MRFGIVFLMLLVPPVLAESQGSATGMADLAEILRPLQRELKLPGVSAAIVRDGRIAAAGAAGTRKARTNIPVQVGDKFHIGSCTKSMTALLAILQQGKLPLETKVPEIFPDWELADGVAEITLRMLLQNRSGIRATPEKELWAEAFSAKGPALEQREKFLRTVVKAPLEAKPGTTTIYSNLGYALAGAMIEKRLGKPWEELVRAEIFERLKLESAGFGPPGPDASMEQPWGHVWKDGRARAMAPVDNPAAIAPAGAVHMSAMDVGRYAAFHLAIARGEVAELRDDITTIYEAPSGSDYALGWLVTKRDWAGGKAIMHAGSNTMFYTVIWLAPKKNFAIVVMTNVGGQGIAEKCDRIAGVLIEGISSGNW